MEPTIDKNRERTRWVPCDSNNKPLVKWSEVRCTHQGALLWPGCIYLAENLKGCRWIVLDFDCDHDKGSFDEELQNFALSLQSEFPTAMLYKPGFRSMHLTYKTNELIPTQHLRESKIDICGNTNNQLRYFKTKLSNGFEMAELVPEILCKIFDYHERKTKWSG